MTTTNTPNPLRECHFTAAQRAKLSMIAHYGTRYEVVLVNHARTVLLGYTSRRSRSGLLAVARKQGPRVIKVAELTDDAVMTFAEWKTLGFSLGNGWRIRFTGRTQRDAIIEGERQFIEGESQ